MPDYSELQKKLKTWSGAVNADIAEYVTLRDLLLEVDAVLAAHSQTPTPTPPPPSDGRPNATNTGPVHDELTRTANDITITTNGYLLQDLWTEGSIYVKASGVTVRNVRAKSLKFYDEDKYGSHRNLVVSHCEFTAPDKGTAITGGHMLVENTHIHHMGSDAFNLHHNAIIYGNYVHHLGMMDDSHADAVSGTAKDGVPTVGVIIRGNNFDIPSHASKGVPNVRPQYSSYRSNGVIFVGLFGTEEKPMIVEGNWLNGGNYTVSSGLVGAEIHYINNRFGREYNHGLRKFHSGVEKDYFSGERWVGNVWDDTGLPA